MKRRTFVIGAGVAPLLAFARPDALTSRKATFEEAGNSIRMTVALPGLFKKNDTDALHSIDSGFDTTLRFGIRVWEWGTRNLIDEKDLLVKIRLDPWKKRYVVSSRGEAGWSKRHFNDRAKAVAAATKLSRVVVTQASKLERGDDGPYYFVEVVALRNPLKESTDRRSKASGRGSGRDLEWFGRLVNKLAGERARAEEIVHVRTNPFYLVPK